MHSDVLLGASVDHDGHAFVDFYIFERSTGSDL